MELEKLKESQMFAGRESYLLPVLKSLENPLIKHIQTSFDNFCSYLPFGDGIEFPPLASGGLDIYLF